MSCANRASFALISSVIALAGCRSTPAAQRAPTPTPAAATATASVTEEPDAGEPDAGESDASADAEAGADPDASVVETDPMDLHRETQEELLSLFTVKDFSEKEEKVIRSQAFLHNIFGTSGPTRVNQGNKAIARHTISREKCLEGLKDLVIQTPEQREKCGADNMVPIWVKGKDPWFCIDVFEFPNKACELPMVWVTPTWAKKVCELEGKRLCSDIEWNIACRGDPEGGSDQRYAYGDELDLEVCHTNLAHRTSCYPRDAQTTWNTCTTDTEPSGSFPRCRSRFGVFDQHGNVAEIMARRDGDRVVSQLKGSAWFYVELAREPDKPIPASTPNKQGAYPDHCNFNPRWHVEPIDGAGHVNYHLGFRCCKSL